MKRRHSRGFSAGFPLLALLSFAPSLWADPTVSRLTPPSNLFKFGDANPPIISRFLPGQRFDLQATISPDPGQTITNAWFLIDGRFLSMPASLTPATVTGLPENTTVATFRAYASLSQGVHKLSVLAIQSDRKFVTATGNFETLRFPVGPLKTKNVIFLIGDGMGIAHRTAARLMLHGASQGKADGMLAMDLMQSVALVMTHSLNSIVTDSSPGSSCYSSGNKGNNNQHGVFPDDTTANFDNPRVELMGEYLARTGGKSLGLVTTSDVFDATPAAWASHTQARSAGTGICDQYLDDAARTGLSVLMGGGRKWFLPQSVAGSARADSTDYQLPEELSSAWGIAPGVLDKERDLIGDFESAGWTYVADGLELSSLPSGTQKLLGLFAFSNMNIALDKIDARRNPAGPNVVDDYGFPNQPMLDEMTEKALQVLSRNPKGFVLMVEGASIDKQAHNMDSERWILDTIEFDRAVAVCRKFAQQDPSTLIVVTADHECAGINIIGGSRVTDQDLEARAATGGGADQLRRNVVGTYESAGFPRYTIAEDGYPATTNVDNRILIGYAANADRFEDWRTNPRPLRDGQQPFNNSPPLNTYPGGPLDRDTVGAFLVTGQVADGVAAHTASDIPLSADGAGAPLFRGVLDNTEVFFRAMQAVLGWSGIQSTGEEK